MPKDYYEVLGLSRSASADEIAKAYRKLARQHHPDRNPGDKQAEARFKEIQNAYDTLNDPKKKAMYDQFGTEVPPGAGGGGTSFTFGGPGGQQVDPEMAQEMFRRMFGGGGGGAGGFEDLFGSFSGGGRNRGRGRSRAQPAPETVEVEAHVPFLTAALGGTIGLRVGDRDIDVKVPPGFEDGKKLRVAGQGEFGEDILVRIRVDPHPYFRREGRDLLVDVPITVGEAVLGAKIDVPAPDGQKSLTIPAGSSCGQKLRLRGQGVPASGSLPAGDLFVVLKVLVPKGIDAESRRLIEEFSRRNPYDPRAGVW